MDGEPFIVDAATGVVTTPQQTDVLSEPKPARSVVVNAHAIKTLIKSLSTTPQTPPIPIASTRQAIGKLLAGLPDVFRDVLPYAGSSTCDTPVVVKAEEETVKPKDTRPEPML